MMKMRRVSPLAADYKTLMAGEFEAMVSRQPTRDELREFLELEE